MQPTAAHRWIPSSPTHDLIPILVPARAAGSPVIGPQLHLRGSRPHRRQNPIVGLRGFVRGDTDFTGTPPPAARLRALRPLGLVGLDCFVVEYRYRTGVICIVYGMAWHSKRRQLHRLRATSDNLNGGHQPVLLCRSISSAHANLSSCQSISTLTSRIHV